MLLTVWQLVKWNLIPDAASNSPFAWLKLAAEKDKAEVLDAAVEFVNALLHGCKQNESLFSSRLNLLDELYVASCAFVHLRQ
jgi:hypothetical protein